MDTSFEGLDSGWTEFDSNNWLEFLGNESMVPTSFSSLDSTQWANTQTQEHPFQHTRLSPREPAESWAAGKEHDSLDAGHDTKNGNSETGSVMAELKAVCNELQELKSELQAVKSYLEALDKYNQQMRVLLKCLLEKVTPEVELRTPDTPMFQQNATSAGQGRGILRNRSGRF